MRYYFHLTRQSEILPDTIGVEAADLAQLRMDVLSTLRELLSGRAQDIESWEGWRLDVVSEGGETVWSVDVGVDPPVVRDPPLQATPAIH